MHNAKRMTSTDLAGIIAAAAADKKARDVVVLDISGKTTIADYFVVCEGDWQYHRRVQAARRACARGRGPQGRVVGVRRL